MRTLLKILVSLVLLLVVLAGAGYVWASVTTSRKLAQTYAVHAQDFPIPFQLTAEEADRAGLVSRVVPAAELREEAQLTAEAIASKPLPALYAATAALDVALESTLAEGLRFERQAFAGLFDTADQKEGMAAFGEKRAPEFRHR